jgi:hypothetical protein
VRVLPFFAEDGRGRVVEVEARAQGRGRAERVGPTMSQGMIEGAEPSGRLEPRALAEGVLESGGERGRA